jgi:mannose-6-phosphate isomerase
MGTHVSGPSRISSTGELLSDHLKANPDLIGRAVLEKFKEDQTGDLPFLFKVLSIEKALSIQTHPDKETARRLHAEKPEIYKGSSLVPYSGLADLGR